jgi:hypothetical protein
MTRDDVRKEAGRIMLGVYGPGWDNTRRWRGLCDAIESALLSMRERTLEEMQERAAKVASSTASEFARIANANQNDVLWPTFLARAEVAAEIARDIRSLQPEKDEGQ